VTFLQKSSKRRRVRLGSQLKYLKMGDEKVAYLMQQRLERIRELLTEIKDLLVEAGAGQE